MDGAGSRQGTPRTDAETLNGGGKKMARFDPVAYDAASLGPRPAPSGDAFLQLGMAYATGRDGTADLISAHKWFNLAALKGNREALRYRQEVAREMSEIEIAEAQRAAREWLYTH